MLYALMIIPHLLAFVVLLGFVLRSGFHGEESDDFRDGWDDGGPHDPPSGPRQGPSLDGPPLPDADPPRRRIRVGERLSDLYRRRPRREIEPGEPVPDQAPSRTGAASGTRPR